MLRALNRTPMRPAHLHVKLSAAGFAPVVTALYAAGDPYLESDAVFGVRSSLIAVYEPYDAARHGPTDGEPPRWVVQHDFTLADR
jgi:protocatechuate 3,4-dioxygenase beta subunit